MAFQKYTGGISHDRKVPAATYEKCGSLYLNKAAFVQFGLKDYKYVRVYFDNDQKKFALRFLTQPDDERKDGLLLFRKACTKSTYASHITFRGVLAFFDTNLIVGKRYLLEKDLSNRSVVVFSLEQKEEK